MQLKANSGAACTFSLEKKKEKQKLKYVLQAFSSQVNHHVEKKMLLKNKLAQMVLTI